MMIFVNTTEETSLSRNRKRARTLPDKNVSKMWKEVQENIGAFQRLFGENFVVVDNTEGKDYKRETEHAYKKASVFAKKKPKTRKAASWMRREKGRRGIK